MLTFLIFPLSFVSDFLAFYRYSNFLLYAGYFVSYIVELLDTVAFL